MEKQKITLRVAGKDYTMVSSDSQEHMSRVAAYVDRRIMETATASRLPKETVSVLVALNMADELMKAQDENARLRRQIAELRRTGDAT